MLDKYLQLDDKIIEKLELFYKLHQSALINLTSIKDKESFYIKHYLDSVYFFYLKKINFDSVCDVGSGGGFPGIVISLFFPQTKVFLVESIKKKALFLEQSATLLELKNVTVINDRIEHIKGLTFDLFTARGVSSVLDILKKTENVSRETSKWLLYKGEKLDEELRQADSYIKKRKLEVENVRIEEPFFRTYCYIHR